MTEVREGYVLDYISGDAVRGTPEELEAVQTFARALVEDYGYPKSHIRTRPQWRVKARPSDEGKEYPVDIAVFSSPKHTDDNLICVIECKQREKKDGLGQLKDYLRFSAARIGVWFNGEERVFLKKSEGRGQVNFEPIPNIPRFGERLEDIGKFRRRDLRVPHSLQVTFRAIRNHLAGNVVGTTRDETLAQQLINIIFCKIYDERFTKPDDLVSFRAGIDESPEDVHHRLLRLFDKVKSKYSEVIDVGDKLSLDEASTAYVVGELQNYCLTEAARDAVADAFEVFIGSALKGGQGQFFTPRNVVRLLVELADPNPGELLIDPACGSGGFLVESLKYVWDKLDKQAKEYGWSDLALNEEKTAVAIKNIAGVEKDDFLSKVAKAYMAILGDGKGGIVCDDSLNQPSQWKRSTRQYVSLGKFDVLLTNPPFGKDIKVIGREKLEQFDLAYAWKREGNAFERSEKLKTESQPQILFIERSLQLLKDGGRLGIVLPETFFHAPKVGHVMQFLAQHNLLWIVDLPHNTFRPHNNAKCIGLILQKGRPQGDLVRMAVAEQMGHDHQGKPIYRWNPETQKINRDELWDDVAVIVDELRSKRNRRYTFDVEAKTVASKGVFVPRYFWETRDKEVERIAASKNLQLVSMKELEAEGVIKAFDGHGSPPAEYKRTGDIPYIRVKDVVNWELYKDPTSKIPEDIYRQIKGTKKDLCEGDVLFVRRGSYRIGSVAMVSKWDREVLLTREIHVFRVVKETNRYGIDPFYLLYLLSHRLTGMQAFSRVLIETTLPNIGSRWKELRLPISRDVAVRKSISDQVKSVMEQKWGAVSALNDLVDSHGELTT